MTRITKKATQFLATFVAGMTLWNGSAGALPPTGLLQLDVVPDERAKIGVFDGTAYVSRDDGVYPITSSGLQSTIIPTLPFSPGTAAGRTTRVIRADDGKVYYGTSFFNGVQAVHEVSQPDNPIMTWSNAGLIVGVLSDLRGIGQSINSQVTELQLDGNVKTIDLSDNAVGFDILDAAPNGVLVGTAGIPDTLGAGAALLRLNGEVGFLDEFGFATSTRLAGSQRANIGYATTYDSVAYGDGRVVDIDRSIGVTSGFERVLVSETDFVAFGRRNRATEQFVYFPGVNPAGLDRSVPLLDFFPELQQLGFDQVVDIASSEGQIHLLLSGDDGLWLFAAPDPTVIPEPGTLSVALLLHVAFFSARRHRSARRASTGTLPSKSQVAKNCC